MELVKRKTDSSKVRFSDADWFEGMQGIDVVVGGLGSLGSWLSLYLARCGANIYGFDMDTVDAVNMAGQLYNLDQISSTKADALQTTIRNFCGYDNEVEMSSDKYIKGSLTSSVIFSCFDNMEARKIMFENWCTHVNDEELGKKDTFKLFVDARLTAETYEVFAVTPDKIEEYKKTLFTDGEADELPCSFKSTTHVAAMAAGTMLTCLTNYVANVTSGVGIRELPFKLTYSSQLFMLELQDNY